VHPHHAAQSTDEFYNTSATTNNPTQSKYGNRKLRGWFVDATKRRNTTGEENIDSRQLAEFVHAGYDLLQHYMKLFKQTCKLDIRKYFFTQRIAKECNIL